MQMASGISEAMITTAGGLALAIPCMLFYVLFRNRIQKRIADMEAAITHVLSLISVQMNRERRPVESIQPMMNNSEVITKAESLSNYSQESILR